MRNGIAVGLAWLLVITLTPCQADSDIFQPLVVPAFRQLTVADGLPDSRIFSVIQDHQGYIWAASENGIARYDGYQSRIFRHSTTKSASLSGNIVRGMYVDPSGNLWIGVYDGDLDLYHPETGNFSHFAPSTTSRESKIWALNGEGDDIWLGTIGNGLYLFNIKTGKFTHFTHNPANPKSLISNRVNNIFIASDGTVWLATANGLDSFDKASQNFTHHSLGPNTTGISVWSVAEDNQGRLWIGTNNGLYTGIRSFMPFKLPPDNKGLFSHEIIKTLLFSASGSLWIGTFHQGLWLLDTKTFKLTGFKHQPSIASSLIDNHVWDIFEDKDKTLWITTVLGISTLVQNSMKISLFTEIEQDGSSTAIGQISGMYSHGDDVYVATSQGSVLYHISKSGIKSRRISTRWTLSFAQGHEKNTIWSGAGQGLLQLLTGDGQVLRTFNVKYAKQPIGDITSIADQGKYVWLGSFSSGLYRLTPSNGSVRHYSFPTNNNLWRQINELRLSGNILIIGTSSGIALLDTASGKFHIASLADNPEKLFSVASIQEIDGSRYYFGTTIGLLSGTLDRNNLVLKLNPVPGLSGHGSDAIVGIEKDNNGNLWLSSNYYLTIYDPTTGHIRHFTRSQGLPFFMFTVRAHTKTSHDRLWFGGPYGLISFIPDTLKSIESSQPVVINSMQYYKSDRVFDVPVAAAKIPALDYKANIIQFEFSALNYADPSGTRYRYRLLGLNRNWIGLGARHQLTLSNLGPGSYTLELEASVSPGAWNTAPTGMKFRILPPWWRTWWAYAVYVLLILSALLLYAYIQQRKLRHERLINARLRDADALKSTFVTQLENQVSAATGELRNSVEALTLKNKELEIAQQRASDSEQVKSQFLANMSHELRTPLNAMQGYLKLLSGTSVSAEQANYLRTVRDSSESLLAIINDTLDLSRIESGQLLIDEVDFNIRDLIEHVVELLGPSAHARGLEFIRIVPPDLPLRLRGDPLRIRQILTNLAGNAIKFTHRGSICIRAQQLEQSDKHILLGITVSDTGVGIPSADIKKLLHPYTRQASSDRQAIEGTGLGLSICKKLLDLMGGDMEIMSTPAIGSTFEFRLRLKCSPQPATVAKLPPGIQVILRDPHPLSNQSWQASLQRFGLNVDSLREPTGLPAHAAALIFVLGIGELTQASKLVAAWRGVDLPCVLLVPSSDHAILQRLGEQFGCPVLSTLTHEDVLRETLKNLLPATMPSVTANPPQEATVSNTTSLPILVADDNAVNRKLLVTLLRLHGYVVREAASGEALLKLATQPHALLLLDIHMPGMSGFDVMGKLPAQADGTRPPVIAVSADALPETRDRALAAGMADYLIKPYSEEQLLELLAKHLHADKDQTI